MSRAQEIALAQLAASQYGVLTAADLAHVTGRGDELRRRARSGLWTEVVPGVVVSASVPVTDTIRSAALVRGHRALLSHHTAARLSGIWVPDEQRTWVTVPFCSEFREATNVRVVRSRRYPERCLTNGLLRWTLPPRTVADLGMCLTAKQLEAVLLSAVRAGAATAADVDAEASALRGRKGIGQVRAAAALWRPERESLLEDRLDADVRAVVSHPLTRQRAVYDAHGQLIARVDVAVDELRLAFEADGLLYHSTDEQLARDQRRDRILMALGWQSVRYREGSLDDRLAVRREITAIVRRRERDLWAA